MYNNKNKFALWISPDVRELVDANYKADCCRSGRLFYCPDDMRSMKIFVRPYSDSSKNEPRFKTNTRNLFMNPADPFFI